MQKNVCGGRFAQCTGLWIHAAIYCLLGRGNVCNRPLRCRWTWPSVHDKVFNPPIRALSSQLSASLPFLLPPSGIIATLRTNSDPSNLHCFPSRYFSPFTPSTFTLSTFCVSNSGCNAVLTRSLTSCHDFGWSDVSGMYTSSLKAPSFWSCSLR